MVTDPILDIASALDDLRQKLNQAFGYSYGSNSIQRIVEKIHSSFIQLNIELGRMEHEVSQMQEFKERLGKLEEILNDPRNIVNHRLREYDSE